MKHPQLRFGQAGISDIHFDACMRDDIPAILNGLQHVCTTALTGDKVLALPGEVYKSTVSEDKNGSGIPPEVFSVFEVQTGRVKKNRADVPVKARRASDLRIPDSVADVRPNQPKQIRPYGRKVA